MNSASYFDDQADELLTVLANAHPTKAHGLVVGYLNISYNEGVHDMAKIAAQTFADAVPEDTG